MSELVKLVSPVGKLTYAHISGQGKLNYNEDGYEYTATVYLDKRAQSTKDFIKILDDLADQLPSDKTEQTRGYKDVFEDEDGKLFVHTKQKQGGKPTDLISVQFKTNTTFADGKAKKIAVYNAKGKKVELGDRRIGNGSLGALSGAAQQYTRGKNCGISVYLNSIQITKFIEYTDDGGFEEQDGDFDGFDADSEFQNASDSPEQEASTEAAKPAKPAKVKPKL